MRVVSRELCSIISCHRACDAHFKTTGATKTYDSIPHPTYIKLLPVAGHEPITTAFGNDLALLLASKSFF